MAKKKTQNKKEEQKTGDVPEKEAIKNNASKKTQSSSKTKKTTSKSTSQKKKSTSTKQTENKPRYFRYYGKTVVIRGNLRLKEGNVYCESDLGDEVDYHSLDKMLERKIYEVKPEYNGYAGRVMDGRGNPAKISDEAVEHTNPFTGETYMDRVSGVPYRAIYQAELIDEETYMAEIQEQNKKPNVQNRHLNPMLS